MLKNSALEYIKRKSLLYKTGVEYGDYTINHVLGCSHGCLYPCYAMLMARRFGKVESYEEWVKPKIVGNAIDLLKKEIPNYKTKIKFVHFCFSTDPFMFGYKEIEDLSIKLMKILNDANIKCTVLTKGCLPIELVNLSRNNEYGITLVSLNENFRQENEPFSAPYKERIEYLYKLHKHGIKTWVSIEPYPTPNMIQQNIEDILTSISFVDKIIFGKMNYNSMVSKFANYKKYFNLLSEKIIKFCQINNKKYHIKEGTITDNS